MECVAAAGGAALRYYLISTGNMDIAAAVNRNSIWVTEAPRAAGAVDTPRYRRSASQCSPATTLVGAIRGIDPSRNFEILHLSISGWRFTAHGTPAS